MLLCSLYHNIYKGGLFLIYNVFSKKEVYFIENIY